MDSIKAIVLEVIVSVIPITLIVLIIEVCLKVPSDDMIRFLGGVFLVCLGLILFFLGAKIGILPIGEMIGEYLPQTGKIALVLFLGIIIGFAVTVAEPDVQILGMQVDLVSGGTIPKIILVSVVALGVGIYIAIALFKLIKGIHIKYFLLSSYSLVLLIALFTPPEFISIALDAGGVTTGPMTVPFILALGVGVAAAFGGKRDSFGFVGLASVGPIIAVLLLGVIFG